MPRLVAAPDKLRGTATAAEAAVAMAAGAKRCGWACDLAPVSDGGEGLLEVLGGANRTSRVSGPDGRRVDARWLLDGTTAVIESAEAAGLAVVGGAEGNDPMTATTRGVGELILEAVRGGAKRITVGLGGSASTDGGQGCLEAIGNPARLGGVRLVVACDVETGFVEAAREFAPQKGASPAQVALLERRLERLASDYLAEHSIDVTTLLRAGAAGGLAGGLAAIGARLVSGFDLVADSTGLAELVAGADLVVTAEGFVDSQSFAGKAVGGVVELAREAGVPALVIAGAVDDEVRHLDVGATVISLVDRFGESRAFDDALACIEAVVTTYLTRHGPPHPPED
ncbi:MAG TPA: glycerate kinase [Acidimicrobiales bacterium]|nr:glycerate kinase [Acidimicrobiales bacterium]